MAEPSAVPCDGEETGAGVPGRGHLRAVFVDDDESVREEELRELYRYVLGAVGEILEANGPEGLVFTRSTENRTVRGDENAEEDDKDVLVPVLMGAADEAGVEAVQRKCRGEWATIPTERTLEYLRLAGSILDLEHFQKHVAARLGRATFLSRPNWLTWLKVALKIMISKRLQYFRKSLSPTVWSGAS